MNKVFLALTALAFSSAASAVRAETVHFDSGSAELHRGQVVSHKKKVWVPAHRSKGRLVKGHYVWR
jgi:hypothetical protein